jgi:hypothetical protein
MKLTYVRTTPENILNGTPKLCARGLCRNIRLQVADHNSDSGEDGGDTEAMRVSSPDGKLDAVLVEDSSGGALGGIFWFVYVVPKGKAPKGETTRLFFADELTKGTIVWSKRHLVEIHYDKTSIMQFRNISATSENGLEYVELRLVPSSDYSLMTPEGGWRSDN